MSRISKLKEVPERIDLFDNGIISEGVLRPWGLYNVLNVSSALNKDTISKSVLIGQKQATGSALVLVDTNKPLQMLGGARIIGDAHLPKKGIKRGYLSSQSFIPNNFLFGEKYYSKNSLPSLRDIFHVPEQKKKLFIEELDKDSSLYQAFDSTPIVINVNKNIVEGKNISGHVLLESKDSIFIKRDNLLEDVLINAPIVVFEKGFQGSAQVLASEKIILEEDVVLKYPSSIYLNARCLGNAEVYLGRNSKVLGKVILFNEFVRGTRTDLVKIDKGALVVGQIYSKRGIELRGMVIGSVYANNFYLQTEASSHINYIEDGVIDNRALLPGFLGNVIDENNNKAYGIIKSL
ncbi:MAG: hypothetical protein GYB37_15740 [Algicola sp.]|nr:hypothetical protein [Algicola sp.]